MAGADPTGAQELCRQVLATEPENGFALHLLGVLRLRGGDATQAEALLRRAVRTRPSNIESRLALAEACLAMDANAAAARELEAVVAARPGHAAALAALAIARLRVGEMEGARLASEQAVAADPGGVEPYVALGTVLSGLRDWKDARRALETALHRDPTHGPAHLNLGNVLLEQGDEVAAERHLVRATERMPRSAEAWASLGFLLTGMDRLTQAIAAYDTAVALRPNCAQAYWNRSFAHLRGGDFARGWADYEWRRRHPRFAAAAPGLPGPEWDGGDLCGRRLLVDATQGLGDTIQLARYLPLLASRGAEVSLRCAPTLTALLRPLTANLVHPDERLPAYDCWIDQMSLPGRFGTTVATIPAAAGYLTCSSERPAGPALRVGLVCAGNPQHSNDLRRSMSPEHLAPLRAVSGVQFASLQVGPTSGALAAAFDVPDRAAELTDLAATARIVAGLDLVVTVDTAMAHLAGALGRPVWIMVPRAPDWRWLAGREDSPWYASARLFRQERAGDWPGVVTRVAAALARWARSAAKSESCTCT